MPANFEPEAVELFRSIASKANRPTHFYPMAMATYSIMPPPNGRNAALGTRHTRTRASILIQILTLTLTRS